MIRHANFNEAKRLYAIEKEVFSNDTFALSQGAFVYHLKRNTIFVIEVENIVVGYILWLKRKSYFRLYSLAILPLEQNKGLAKALLKYSLVHLKEKSFSLEVKVSNVGAISLYEKYGFRIEKILKHYYETEDGYLMRKKKE